MKSVSTSIAEREKNYIETSRCIQLRQTSFPFPTAYLIERELCPLLRWKGGDKDGFSSSKVAEMNENMKRNGMHYRFKPGVFSGGVVQEDGISALTVFGRSLLIASDTGWSHLSLPYYGYRFTWIHL